MNYPQHWLWGWRLPVIKRKPWNLEPWIWIYIVRTSLLFRIVQNLKEYRFSWSFQGETVRRRPKLGVDCWVFISRWIKAGRVRFFRRATRVLCILYTPKRRQSHSVIATPILGSGSVRQAGHPQAWRQVSTPSSRVLAGDAECWGDFSPVVQERENKNLRSNSSSVLSVSRSMIFYNCKIENPHKRWNIVENWEKLKIILFTLRQFHHGSCISNYIIEMFD